MGGGGIVLVELFHLIRNKRCNVRVGIGIEAKKQTEEKEEICSVMDEVGKVGVKPTFAGETRVRVGRLRRALQVMSHGRHIHREKVNGDSQL